ncbi:MAG: TetR family transcriptional regulator [Deltaproteobacteria bacterium]
MEATRRVITKQGFDAITMERVARDAGITRGASIFTFATRTR